MSVIEEIAAERQRQIDAEGWTPEHDDGHVAGQLATAGACYALGDNSDLTPELFQALWPWSPKWWKPKDRRRDLIRAAALLVAEIERLDRAGS